MTDQFHELLRGFCRRDCDRFGFLQTFLEWKKVPYRIFEQGGRHILIDPGGPCLGDHYRKVLTAHYDRVAGTPGANDNSAAVFLLLSHMDALRRADYPHNSLILLTDREELVGEKTIYDQGSYHLGRFWREEMGEGCLFVVFDMCGIGDTVVWGRNDRKLRKENPEGGVSGGLIRSIDRVYEALSDLLLRYSRQTEMALNDLFSDDLGFILSGHPAVQFSLLPWKEAELWRRDPARRPASWEVNHSAADRYETLEDGAFRRMEKFLRDLSRYQFPLPG